MYDVIIIGAGPAGLTAGLYCGRAKLHTKIIEKSAIGGQVLTTEEIENYPGVLKVNSKNLIEVMTKQVKDLPDVEWAEFKEVVSVGYEKSIIKVSTTQDTEENKLEYRAKALIIAAGAHPKELDIPGEKNLKGKGVSYCATCDGPLFRDKNVAVIGGGDTAIEEALYLTKFCNKVYVIHRRDSLRAVALLGERAKNNPKIELVLNSVAVEILGKQRLEGVRINNMKTNKPSEISCSGVFIFVGYTPDTNFAEGLLDLDKDKFIITDEEMNTSKKGIFACGDCRRRPFKQIVTACGEGAVAAHSVEKYLSQENV